MHTAQKSFSAFICIKKITHTHTDKQAHSTLFMDDRARTQASVLLTPNGLQTFSVQNAVQVITSLHLISGVECVPRSPFTSPHQQPNTNPADPWDALFSLIFLDIPLGFALSCANDHLPAPIQQARRVHRVIR